MSKLKHFPLFAVTMFAASSLWAQTQGPWTYMDYRTGCCNRNDNMSISFDGLNNSHWATVSGPWVDGDGIGFTVKDGKADSNSKNAVFSTYYIDQNVESYSRKRTDYTIDPLLPFSTLQLTATVKALKAGRFVITATLAKYEGYCASVDSVIVSVVDPAAIAAVVDKIDAIGVVTYPDSKDAIDAARANIRFE